MIMSQTTNKFFITVSIILPFIGMILIVAQQSDANPIISWMPESLSQTVVVGDHVTIPVTLVASKAASNVEVLVVPEISAYVQVTPMSFEHIDKGEVVSLEVEIAAPLGVKAGVSKGTIQLRNLGKPPRNLSKPLPMVITLFTGDPFYSSINPDIMVEDNGARYPVNRIAIGLPIGSGIEVAADIADGIGAQIIGFSPSANLYNLQVPTDTIADLDSIINMLEADHRVDFVTKSYFMGLEAVSNDYTNLKSRDVMLTAAYDKIQIEEAWNKLTDARDSFHTVRIGIIDQGIDTNHPELIGIDYGLDPNIVSKGDHGTSVVGIIGATNIGSDVPDSPQMNGIVSGIPDLSEAKSAINYEIILREVLDITQLSLTIDNLVASSDVQIINMSIGTHPRSKVTSSIKNIVDDEIFHDHKKRLKMTFEAYKEDILFVASAGNAGIDVHDHIPGGIEVSNLVTVAATNLEDQRSTRPADAAKESNYGNGVTLAAPGEMVYAPVAYSPPLDDQDYASPFSFQSPYIDGCVGGFFWALCQV